MAEGELQRPVAFIGGKDGVFTRCPGTPHEANAAYIVKACNEHEGLRELVADLWHVVSNGPDHDGDYYDLKQRVEEA